MQLTSSLWTAVSAVSAIDLDPSDFKSIQAAQNVVIEGTSTYCPWVQNKSGATPGMFQEPYYWWEAGVVWGSLIDWSAYTNNHTYDQWIKEAIVIQSGSNWNFMTENQTSVEGNDDQAFWGITAMNAAEKNFSLPDKKYPPWLYYAQATFNTMANRWSTENCRGGSRWQIYTWNAGYDYKNMVANGCLFHLAARLTRFTNNESYIEWAEKVWNWAIDIHSLSPANPHATDPSKVYMSVLDGAHTTDNCSDISGAEWTYDQGLMISGCAYLYNYTGDSKWLDRLEMSWSRATYLFDTNNADWVPGNYILYEPACMLKNESIVRCSNDQRCFKGIMFSFLGLAIQVHPALKETFKNYIQFSAQAAAWSCTGGTDGHTCGLSWLHEGWDGWYGLGEQICAIGVFNASTSYTKTFAGPYTASDLPEVYHITTNTSVGTSNGSTTQGGGQVYGWGGEAGSNSSDVQAYSSNITTADKGGAGFLTAIIIIFIVAGSSWLIL